MTKTTLKDVARAAGVGTATVERVVNGRGGVRFDKVEKVIVAAKKLNYRYSVSQRYRGVIRIEVILVRPETNFYSRTNSAFERIAALLDNNIIIHRTFVHDNDPVSFAQYISEPKFRRSGLIVVAPNFPEIVESVRRAASSGIPVIQIMAHPAPELPYVGIDNYAAGRTAAFYMVGMLVSRSGSIIAQCHSGDYENHRERIRGFSDYIQSSQNKNHCFSEVSFNFDDEYNAMERLNESLHRDVNIMGLYTAGGDNVAIAEVLKKAKDRKIFWVGHELTEHTSCYLRQGLMSIVLDQSPEVQARRSIDMILKKLGMIDVEVSTDPVRFMTITPENL